MSDIAGHARGMGGELREMHLFAGAGGGILGGMLLGHRPVCAVEIDEFCREVLKQRQRDGILPEDMEIFGDIREFDGTPWRGKVDVIAGGFPCQDISAAGRGKGIHGERSSLYFELVRIVREIRPRYVFLENSPMLVNRGLDVVLGEMAQLGFDAAWTVLSAADCGANHLRKRIWILADAVGIGIDTRRTEPAGLRGAARADGSGASVADSISTGLEGHTRHGEDIDGQGRLAPEPQRSARTGGLCGGSGSCERRNTECGLGGMADGLAPRLDCDYLVGPDWWEEEPEIPRVTIGQFSRTHRLKALGNGQVPRVAAAAWTILERTLRNSGVETGGICSGLRR